MGRRLTNDEMKFFVGALVEGFDQFELTQLLRFELNKNLAAIALGNSFQEIVFRLVDKADREGWALSLLRAARAKNPGNPALVELGILLGTLPVSPGEKSGFEKIVRERAKFIDVFQFRERLGRLENWICAIEGRGTGILIGPDLVMTNYHVVEDILNNESSPRALQCRFDFKALENGELLASGQTVGLIDGAWCVEKSPYGRADHDMSTVQWQPGELDFAILRLARAVGNEAAGVQDNPVAAARGWLSLSAKVATAHTGDDLFVLQHPQDLDALPRTVLQPMKLTVGSVLGSIGDGLRMRHDASTLPGSSGSACFNADLEWVALHHAGEPNNRLDYKGKFNQAIPMAEIARFLAEKGHAEILDIAPDRHALV